MQIGDLVGCVPEGRTSRIALIKELRAGKAFLHSPPEAKLSKGYPLRDLFLIASCSDWQDQDLLIGLSSIRLAPSIFATAWMQSQGKANFCSSGLGASILDFSRLLFNSPSPAELASCWLSVAANQDLFRLKRDTIYARNIDELRSLRVARRRKHLALEIKVALELVQPSTFIANEEFPHECLIEAEKLLSQCLDFQEGDNDRIDLSYLRCFSIDDPSTLEVDDALSLEIDLDGRQKIWVHVADPHRLITANSCLDLEAKRRASSLYLSDRLVPMFPLQLGAGPFSLTPGPNKAALSVAVCLDCDGSILSCEIYRSWVRITYALSYNDADELIELAPPEDPDLSLLHNLLITRRTWRLGQGALMMDQAEGRLFRSEGELKLEITEPCSARGMVAEAMVLAGAAVANWAQKEQLAMPFRGQAGNQSLSDQQLLALPPGAVRWAHQRLGLGRSRLHSSPAPHQALGLESYLQWTSPIRRYADLIAHRQWLQYSGLLKGTPNNEEDIKPQLEQLEQQSKEVAQISREDQRACLLEWLQLQKQKRELQPAIMLRWLREDQDLALLRIEGWAMELPARLRDRAIPGDSLNVQIQEVDPGRDLLHLRATIG